MGNVETKEQPTYTAIIACPRGFDIKLSNAVQTTRLGYAHGFPLIGVTALLVEYHNLVKCADWYDNPIFWMTAGDYNYINKSTIEMLKRHPHIIQVNTWFDGMEKVHANFGAPGPALIKRTLHRILDSGAAFVWCSAPEPYFNSYENWIEIGEQKLISLPWACDNARYYPSPGEDKFSDVEMAFVGGYRSYKEPQYQAYLWSYKDKLQTWGYSEWPVNYQGYLDNNEEKWLYQNAILCPTISEPQFSVTGDTVERPFKILGSGGVTVFDCTAAYTHLFRPGEVLIPDNIKLYHQMVDAMLTKPELNQSYRQAGYRKIMMELGL
jgi:hypothetical protein